jgi:hypothetical protein
LHSEKYSSLGHKHLTPCNKRQRVPFGRFQRTLLETFGLKIHSRARPSNLQGICIPKNILLLGIKISLLVIRDNDGFYLAVFKGDYWKLLGLKFILEHGVNPKESLHSDFFYSLEHKHFTPCKKRQRGFPFGRFQRTLLETFGLKINFGAWPSILQGVCIPKNILIRDINKHVTPSKKRQRGFPFCRFQMRLLKTFGLKIHSGARPSIRQGVCINKRLR